MLLLLSLGLCIGLGLAATSGMEKNSQAKTFVDVHAHVTDASFNNDLTHVLAAAKSEGVISIIGVSENCCDAERLLALTKSSEMVRVCCGTHPVQQGDGAKRSANKSDVIEMLGLIRREASTIVGVGEVGLDFQPHLTPIEVHKDEQRYVFRQQIELAKELNLPLNVHSRSAGRPTITFLKECGAKNVVMHAFDGNKTSAAEGIAAGFYFSVPPIVAREPQMRSVLCSLPLDRLLLESDAPALAPIKPTKDTPQRNEPKNVSIAFRAICDAHKTEQKTEEEIAAILLANTRKLFPKVL